MEENDKAAGGSASLVTGGEKKQDPLQWPGNERQVPEEIFARQLVEENEERLRMAIEATKLGTWEYYPISGRLNWSAECKNIYGLGTDEEVDMSLFSQHIYPDDRELVEGEIQRAMDPGGDGHYDITYRIIRFDDKGIRWIHPRGKVFFNTEKKVERFIGTVVDISEYKAFEESLRESEQRARIAIEAADMGTFDWDLTNNLFYSSERLVNIFGFTNQAEVSHRDLISRFHPDDKPVRDRAVADSFDKGGLVYEARVVWPDSTERWVKVYGKVIHSNTRELKRMYGIVVDITEQKSQSALLEKIVEERTQSLKNTNDELRKSEERYYRMTDEVQDYAILLLSSDGYILNWNKGAERIKGYHESEVIGKHFAIFYLPADRETNLPGELLQEATDQGRAMHEGWRMRKDGSKFWSSVVITALHDGSNNIIGFSKVTRDLTERKLAEDRLMEYTRELEAQNKELEQYAYVASHDLQEPLRKIQTFTEILEKHLDDEKAVRKYLDKIKSSANRMTQLIRSILDYSRLGNIALSLEPVDLNTILENVKTDLELLITEKNVQIIHDTLPIVYGVPLQLQQLFLNLLSNAIKFSERNPVVHISVRMVKGEEIQKHPGMQANTTYAELIFRDNGIGFEQKYAARIFTIFQRLHGQKSYPGTGIGLALCKRIVDNHQGFIDVESEPGQGSIFYIYLPAVY